jgi:hypothetical protein
MREFQGLGATCIDHGIDGRDPRSGVPDRQSSPTESVMRRYHGSTILII